MDNFVFLFMRQVSKLRQSFHTLLYRLSPLNPKTQNRLTFMRRMNAYNQPGISGDFGL